MVERPISPPFSALAAELVRQSPLRAAITAAWRLPEPTCLPPLLAKAAPAPEEAASSAALARRLVTALRAKRRHGTIDALVQEFALSTSEGVALMCLAEALLRIPDDATRDALIRDKIAGGDWQAHLGLDRPLFVNAASWGLLLTGRLTAAQDEAGLGATLARLVARAGQPVIRRGMDAAMRMLGEQFVAGRTIKEALHRARGIEARGFRHSYDMLGEAAMTAADAAHYRTAYEDAIHAIGKAAAGRGIIGGPGISIKLSALHPRYARSQRARVMAELAPTLLSLARLARGYDIGLNIDAEETDRLDLSLDLLEGLCLAPELAGWDGIGFVVQAYQKRAPFVLDWIIDLARRSRHRIMLRLVKGAYWDAEIKRAQLDGFDDFPVFTRKIHTDVSYLACARKLLAAPDAVFPQFATHNAQTLSAIHAMAGEQAAPDRYEFQCLHGMGEPLYEEVTGPAALNRPCRIYAPVGTHETLLAYLVRRLLENGANSSFVNRIGDASVPIEELITDPVTAARAVEPLGAPHPRIALPRHLFGTARRNALGLDLANEACLTTLSEALSAPAVSPLAAAAPGEPRPIRNPADHGDVVGHVVDATPAVVEAALSTATEAAPAWAALSPAGRAEILDRAAALMEARMPALLDVIVREAGKSMPNAVGEVREAVDFLRYYAAQIRDGWSAATHRPLGVVACISPWNFPLAIFTGQVAATLAAGNAVLAKPAEETPLTAALAIGLLHEAGVPSGALHLLPGDGEVGARLVADPRTHGVMFTGSTEVARLIARGLAERLNPDGTPVPLIAETGGQNAMVVDSTALPEQVVADVLASAFDSAGQRCSALRLLCLQEDVADRVLTMLRGALAELAIGNPDRLATDVGPVITAQARNGILAHIAAMQAGGHAVHALPLPADCTAGTFVPPTIIEINDVATLTREVFGPVLHVLRFRRDALDALIGAINATGYGLTFGVQSRIGALTERLASRIAAGNIYVNRNIIGAVVGVQPFGGHGLSGTGPKAGGPLYLRRLLARCDAEPPLPPTPPAEAMASFLNWLHTHHPALNEAALRLAAASRVGLRIDLAGPVGEENRYHLRPRGTVLCHATTQEGLLLQVAACLATGNHARIVAPAAVLRALENLPPDLAGRLDQRAGDDPAAADAILVEGDRDAVSHLLRHVAAADGPLRSVLATAPDTGFGLHALDMLVAEQSISINTAAAGGNATLLSL